MTMVALVSVDGVTMSKGKLAALSGTELRGVADALGEVPFGPYKGSIMFHMMLYAHSETENFEFQWSDGGGSGVLLSRDDAKPLLFKTDKNVGSAIKPKVLTGTGTKTVPFAQDDLAVDHKKRRKDDL